MNNGKLESENLSGIVEKISEYNAICEKEEYIQFDSDLEEEKEKENSNESYNNNHRSQAVSK